MKRNKETASRNSRVKRFVFLPIFLIGLITLVCASGLSLWVVSLPFFTVRDVLVRGNSEVDLSSLRGQRIFFISLPDVSQVLAGRYPDYEQVRVVRVLPDKLFVDFKRRIPVAMLRLQKPFCVDANSVLFSPVKGDNPMTLPLITGLEKRLLNPRSGMKYNYPQLSVALQILSALHTQKFPAGWRVQKIDAANAASVNFMLAFESPVVTQGVMRQLLAFEVRIGPERISQRMNILRTLLERSTERLQQLSYVDLRFNDPVLKYFDEQ